MRVCEDKRISCIGIWHSKLLAVQPYRPVTPFSSLIGKGTAYRQKAKNDNEFYIAMCGNLSPIILTTKKRENESTCLGRPIFSVLDLLPNNFRRN